MSPANCVVRPASRITAIRGHAISFKADPFVSADALVDIEDALIVCHDDLINAFGPYESLASQLPSEVEIVHYPDALLCAGFVDAHVHYVQTRIIGSYGAQLLDWLERYAFTEEARFADLTYAQATAALFFDRLLASGTTTAAVFCATYPESVDAFFEESLRRGTRMIAGKVMMDRNAPDELLDTAGRGYEESLALIDRWHERGRNLYAITPRFAPSSTPEQLAIAGRLWAEHPGTYVHTHVSENAEELDWVRSLFPDNDGYLAVYDDHGLLGPKTILAHGVHLTRRELKRIHDARAGLAHCPTSNLFLGSGLFDLCAAKDPSHPVNVGLGTDIGAGTSFSILDTAAEAYKVAQLRDNALDATKLFYLATLGGATTLALEDRIGSLQVGKEADFIVLDPRATPLLAARTENASSTEDVMFALATLGDERAVQATYVAGRLCPTEQPAIRCLTAPGSRPPARA